MPDAEPATPAPTEPSPRVERVALLGLVLVVAVLFWPALLGRGVFFERDIISYWLPQATSFVRAVGVERAPPLWSPLFAFGLPMLEDPSYQILYPPTWLNLLLQPGPYYVLFVVIHCLAAGFGLCRLARCLGLSALPAFAAAAAFCASGPVLSAANLHHHFASLAWTPWVLLALDSVISAGTTRDGLALGAVAVAQALAGSADVCLMTAALSLGYVAWWWTHSVDRRRGWRRTLPCLALALAFAAGLSAVQTLPTLSLARSAPRSGFDAATSMYWSIHPLSLLDVLIDRSVAGFPMSSELRSLLFESRGPFLASLYMGLPACLLAILGLSSPARPRLAAWLLVGFGLCMLAALGRHTPVLPVLLRLPMVGLLRYPAKAMWPASLLWALLVGLGFAAWQRRWSSADRHRAAAVAGLALLIGAMLMLAARRVDSAPRCLMELTSSSDLTRRDAGILTGTAQALRSAAGPSLVVAVVLIARLASAYPPGWLSAVLVVIVVGDLIRTGRTVQPLAPPELLQHRPPLLERLDLEAGPLRVYSFATSPGVEPARGPAGWQPSWAAALGAVESLRAPNAARWGIAGSYDGDFTGLAPRAQGVLSQWLIRYRQTPLGRRLLALGSVNHVIAVGDPPFAGLEPLGDFSSVFASPLRLFRVPDPLPRVYWVSRARFVSDKLVVEALGDPTFDARVEVLLPESSPRISEVAGSKASWRVLERRSDRLRLEISATGPGYMVVVEAHHPGWKASIDAEPAPLLKANALFRAVAVPAGTHVIEMRYRPRSVYIGAWVSALTLLVGLGLAGVGARGARPQPVDSAPLAR